MSEHLKLVRKIVMSDGKEYVKQYPDVKRLNVFSVSKLAWKAEDVVDQKLGKLEFEWNGAMLAGKIIGRVVQESFVKQDPRWFMETPEVRYNIPFKWKKNPVNGITLLGHPDLVHLQNHVIIELKTSLYNNKIAEFARLQAALYWAYMFKLKNIDFETKVIKVAVPPKEEILTRVQKVNGAKTMIDRAFKVAKILDEKRRTPYET